MRVREENCNMLLLGAVTAFSVAVAGIVYAMEPGPETQPQAMKQAETIKPLHVTDQSPVRVIGTPPLCPIPIRASVNGFAVI